MQHVFVKSTSIYKRNIIYFFTSFIWAATLSVLPQVFFMTHYPEQKNTYLSLFLLVGTLASIAGILTSQHNKIFSFFAVTARRRKLLTASCILTTAATFSGLFLVKNLSLYFTCFILMKFISNAFYNYIDRLFVAGSDRQLLKIHVRANLFYQLLGIMAAPLYFSFFAANPTQNIVLVWVIAIASLLMVMTDIRKISPDFCEDGKDEKDGMDGGSFSPQKWSPYHRLFVTYSVLVLTAVTMLISMMIYLLKDYYQFNNPAAKGGMMIGVISALAVITVLMSAVLAKPQIRIKNNTMNHQKFSVGANGIAVLVLIVMTLAFYLKITGIFSVLLCLCSFAGISYGIFLFSTRNYASSASENTGLISVYNNLPNYASLAGYLLIFLVSLFARTQASDFSKLMLGIILAFFMLALCALFTISGKQKAEK